MHRDVRSGRTELVLTSLIKTHEVERLIIRNIFFRMLCFCVFKTTLPFKPLHINIAQFNSIQFNSILRVPNLVSVCVLISWAASEYITPLYKHRRPDSCPLNWIGLLKSKRSQYYCVCLVKHNLTHMTAPHARGGKRRHLELRVPSLWWTSQSITSHAKRG